jgi:hypothetical protein
VSQKNHEFLEITTLMTDSYLLYAVLTLVGAEEGQKMIWQIHQSIVTVIFFTMSLKIPELGRLAQW